MWRPSVKYFSVTLNKRLTLAAPHITKSQRAYRPQRNVIPILNKKSTLCKNMFFPLTYRQNLRPFSHIFAPIKTNTRLRTSKNFKIFQKQDIKNVSKCPSVYMQQKLKQRQCISYKLCTHFESGCV